MSIYGKILFPTISKIYHEVVDGVLQMGTSKFPDYLGKTKSACYTREITVHVYFTDNEITLIITFCRESIYLRNVQNQIKKRVDDLESAM